MAWDVLSSPFQGESGPLTTNKGAQQWASLDLDGNIYTHLGMLF